VKRARLLPLFLALAGAPAHSQPTSEAAVKAAFVVKFGAYVDWPAAAGGPFAVCLVGDDALGAALERAAAGQQVAGRTVTVRRLARLDRGSGCAVAVVAGSTTQQVPAALAAAAGEPVLTVTDARWGSARGMIHFEIAANRVRFHIDERMAAASGLSISSKLLALALSVRSRMAR
jgi:hypothetical protein